MKHFYVPILTSLFILTGCAMSSNELRADPHEKGSIRVALPYSVAFANIASSANECFPSRLTGVAYAYTTIAVTYMHVNVTEIETGKLTRVEVVVDRAIGKNNVIVSIDVRSIPAGTEIDCYISQRYFGTYYDSPSFRPIAEAWANGNGTKCS